MPGDLDRWRRRQIRDNLREGIERAHTADPDEITDEPTHPQVHIRHGDQEADIDEELVPLILELWKAGLVTESSCQEDLDGRVYIHFGAAGDAERFLNIVARDADESLESIYNRIAVWDEPEEWEAFRTDRMWHFAAGARDWGAFQEEDAQGKLVVRRTGPVDFYFSVAAMFPRSDLAEVTERMRRHNSHQRARRR
jgi:hypothetical protein